MSITYEFKEVFRIPVVNSLTDTIRYPKVKNKGNYRIFPSMLDTLNNFVVFSERHKRKLPFPLNNSLEELSYYLV